jgi:hypothetical protein
MKLVFILVLTKLYLYVYCESIRHFESKECLGKSDPNIQSTHFVMLFSIKTHAEKYKLKWKDRINIIPAQSSLLFAGKLK